jgi:hypothetical protein
VTVNINSAQIAMNIRAASEKALGITSQQALADCNEYVPDDQDALVNSSNIHSDILHGKLVWATPYARYLYHGVLMVDPKTGSAWAREGQTKVKVSPEVQLKFDKRKNPKAGSHWCERAQADHGEEWRQIYETALRKELNK